LQSLQNIDISISANLDIQHTLNIILDQVTAQLGVDAADILLLNQHTAMLKYAAGCGLRTAALQYTHLRLGEGFAGRAASDKRILAITDFDAHLSYFPQSAISNLKSEGFVTYVGVPLLAKDQVLGVFEIFHRSLLNLEPEWLDFLESLATQAAIAIDNAQLFDNLQHSNEELALAYDTTLEGWAKTLELRDQVTEGHSQRVTEMTVNLARSMGINELDIIHIRRGAWLHDIGKMGIPDEILKKPGPLSDDEWTIMRQHPVYAHDLLIPIIFLRSAVDIPYCHHEKWDGSGYPRGIVGDQIPIGARIFSVVDVYDALTSDRPYRRAWPHTQALEFILTQTGKHFDPEVVQAFLLSKVASL